MEETIVLSSINGRELLRNLAIKGVNSFNCHFFNSTDFAKDVLLRSGILINDKEIDLFKQECIIYTLLSDVSYFADSSFEDARKITKAINYARMLCRNNESTKLNEVLSDGEFSEKNKALLDVYIKYINYLSCNKLTDSVQIINKAINEAKTIDSNFVVFKETPLEPLEEELIKKISNNSYKTVSIKDYSNKDSQKPKGITYDNAYGAVNEVEHILGYIAKNNIPYGDCSIIFIDNSYQNHFDSYCKAYDVPMTFGCGIDISNSNAFKVLMLLDRWNKDFNGTDALKQLLYAPEFDKNKLFTNIGAVGLKIRDENELIQTIGNLRISINNGAKLDEYSKTIIDDKEKNRYLIIKGFANEFEKGYSYIIRTYSRIESEFDGKAIELVCTNIDEFYTNVPNGQLEDIIQILSQKKINKTLSKPDAIHVTDLKGALACYRSHMFICGLNASVFPGSPTENYLLLDSDLDRFNEPNVKKSGRIVNDNKKLLHDVLNNATAFNCSIHLSYSGYNLADLKVENASSLLFEIYKEENGAQASNEEFEKVLGEQHKYFDEQIPTIQKVGQKYLQGIKLATSNDVKDEIKGISFNSNISPSTAEIFFDCPRRFYLKQYLGIVEPQEDNPFVALPSNDEGTLIHKCMEDYGNNPLWTKKEFLANAEKILNNYFKERIPIYKNNLDYIKTTFLKMAEIGYDTNPKYHHTIYGSEKWVSGTDPETGLRFGGFVDRIEQLENGKLKIIDYKTYKSFRNEEDDIKTCLQVVLYSYLLELEGKEVECSEYRYLRLNKTISCVYNEAIKKSLHEKLREIKSAIDSGNFPLADDESACTYCKFANICGKNKDEEEAEVDGQ